MTRFGSGGGRGGSGGGPAAGEQALTVLAVVLDEDLRGLLRHMLEGPDCHVLVAADEDQAFDLASSAEIDLLVTEASPSIQGRAIAELLRERTPGLGVLFIIDHPDVTGLEGEATLKKPFSRDELKHAIGAFRRVREA